MHLRRHALQAVAVCSVAVYSNATCAERISMFFVFVMYIQRGAGQDFEDSLAHMRCIQALPEPPLSQVY